MSDMGVFDELLSVHSVMCNLTYIWKKYMYVIQNIRKKIGLESITSDMGVIDELLSFWNLEEADVTLEKLEDALIARDFGVGTWVFFLETTIIDYILEKLVNYHAWCRNWHGCLHACTCLCNVRLCKRTFFYTYVRVYVLCVCTHFCMCSRLCVYMHVCVSVYFHVCKNQRFNTLVNVYKRMHWWSDNIHICENLRIFALCVCVYICSYVYTQPVHVYSYYTQIYANRMLQSGVDA